MILDEVCWETVDRDLAVLTRLGWRATMWSESVGRDAVAIGFAGLKSIIVPFLLAATIMMGCAGRKSISLEPARLRFEVITVAHLNVRSHPSADSQVIGVLRKGESVQVAEELRGWVRVITPSGAEGWVFGPGHITGFPEIPRRVKQFAEDQRKQFQPKDVGGLQTIDDAPKSEKENFSSPVVGAPGTKGSTEADISKPPGDSEPPSRDSSAIVQKHPETSVSDTMVFVEVKPSPNLLKPENSSEVSSSHPASSFIPKEETAKPHQNNSAGTPPTPPIPKTQSDQDKQCANSWSMACIVQIPDGQKAAPVKSAPSFTSPTLAETNSGAYLRCYGKTGEWYQVETGSGLGYLHKSLVQALTIIP